MTPGALSFRREGEGERRRLQERKGVTADAASGGCRWGKVRGSRGRGP